MILFHSGFAKINIGYKKITLHFPERGRPPLVVLILQNCFLTGNAIKPVYFRLFISFFCNGRHSVVRANNSGFRIGSYFGGSIGKKKKVLVSTDFLFPIICLSESIVADVIFPG